VTPSLPDDLVETGDRGVGVDGVVDEISEGLAGELIDDVQDLDGLPGGGDIELVVQRSHVIRPGGPEPVGRCRGVAEALALAALGRYPQAIFTPQTLDLLAVHDVALPAQHGVRSPVPPSRMALSEAPRPHAQITVGVCLGRLVALCRAVLADDLACPPLRDAEPLLEHVNGSASPRRAHQFPVMRLSGGARPGRA
jgi:hypothetical protein